MDWNNFFIYLLQGSIVAFVLLIFYAFFLAIRKGSRE